MKDINTPYNYQQWSIHFNEKGYKWLIGKKENVLFWEDRWVGEQPLAEKFPSLYALSRWKFYNMKMVLDLWKLENSPRWTRSLRAWESELEVEMDSLVKNVELAKKKIW